MRPEASGLGEPFSLPRYLAERRKLVESALRKSLPPEGPGHPAVRAGMRHSLLAEGKRFRPILMLAACEACGGDWEDALEPACAVEFVHAYSLVHDDLPAMDDAELRRGRPTCHRAFGEANAILVGDALLTEAWGIISRWAAARPGRERAALRMMDELARGAGIEGMVSGQAYDIDDHKPADIEALDDLHRLKTGALIKASVRMGAVCAGAGPDELGKLTRYAEAVGLAFQVVDDLLDAEGADTGKDKGADAARGKVTYPVLAGVKGARARAKELLGDALDALEGLEGDTAPLAAIAGYAVERKK